MTSDPNSVTRPHPSKEQSSKKPRREDRKAESTRDLENSSDQSHRHHRSRSRSHSSDKKRRHRSRSHDNVAGVDGADKHKDRHLIERSQSHDRNQSTERKHKNHDRSHSTERKHKNHDRSHSAERKHKSPDRSHSTERKHKSPDRSHSTERKARRHRSKSRSNSSERKKRTDRSKSRDRSNSNDRKHRHRSKSRDRSHSKDRKKSRSRSRSQSSDRKKHHKKSSSVRKHKNKDKKDKQKKKDEIARLKKEMEDQERKTKENTEKLTREIQRKRRQSKLFYIAGFCLVACAIIGVALLFVLNKRDEEAPAHTAVENVTSAPVGPEPSASPTGSFMPSKVSTSNPSVNPSPAPTLFEALFDPPSEEDCAAIIAGQPVAGQDDMVVRDLQVNIDITVADPAITPEDLQDPLQDRLDNILIPELIGCNGTLPARFLESSQLRGQRQLQSSNALRYIFGNAVGTVSFPIGKECLTADTIFNPCYHAEIFMQTFIKEDIPSIQLINLVTELLVEGDSAGNNYGLPPSVVQGLQVLGVENRSPTDQPSVAPSVAPSTMPSMVPSVKPSMVPSDSPSSKPSILLSRQPTNSPILSPTSPPTYDELSDFFREIIDKDPETINNVVAYTVDCEGNQGDLVILGRDDDRTEPACLGHLPRRTYLDACAAGKNPFVVRLIQVDEEEFVDDYEEVVVGYMTTTSFEALDCEENTLDLGTSVPSISPSVSRQPSLAPSRSKQPSLAPSRSKQPSISPSRNPSSKPSVRPSMNPSSNPSRNPSSNPSVKPSSNPSSKPSRNPSSYPSSRPSLKPSSNPSLSNAPSKAP